MTETKDNIDKAAGLSCALRVVRRKISDVGLEIATLRKLIETEPDEPTQTEPSGAIVL